MPCRVIQNIFNQIRNKNSNVRVKSITYLYVILCSYPEVILEKSMSLLEEFLSVSVCDAMPEGRHYGRLSFLKYKELFPKRAEMLFDKFDLYTQKAINEEDLTQGSPKKSPGSGSGTAYSSALTVDDRAQRKGVSPGAVYRATATTKRSSGTKKGLTLGSDNEEERKIRPVGSRDNSHNKYKGVSPRPVGKQTSSMAKTAGPGGYYYNKKSSGARDARSPGSESGDSRAKSHDREAKAAPQPKRKT